jgi:hypothetical protein
MTTLTIELPDADARIAEEKARRANMPLSEWARLRLTGRRRVHVAVPCDEMGYPIGWFDRHAGALADVTDFREPEDRPESPIEPIEL